MWTTMSVKGDEVQQGDIVSGRVVIKVKRARRQGPVTLTHKDGYTEITRGGIIQVERLVEGMDDGDTTNGHHRRGAGDDGTSKRRDTRSRPRPERRTRREISERTNRLPRDKSNRSI